MLCSGQRWQVPLHRNGQARQLQAYLRVRTGIVEHDIHTGGRGGHGVGGRQLTAALALSSAGSGPVLPATRQPDPVSPSEIRAEPTPVNLDEIPEEAVRALFDDQGNFFGPDQRLAQIAKKHEGGFGGYSFHKTDKSHVYVYMLDTTKTQSAEAAFREAYNGMRTVTRITHCAGPIPVRSTG